MRQLLEFLVNKWHWFLFILLETLCFVLIYQNSGYQRSVLISTTNVITGHISSLTGNVSAFFNMAKVNRELAMRNGELEMQLVQLQEKIGQLQEKEIPFNGFLPDSAATSFPYRFRMAQVKSNSVTQLSNYITIDKGKKDGLAPQMGVVSEKGIVGIVSLVSDHFAVVLPVLNPKFKLSCKVIGTNYAGSLVWNGRNARYVQLKELPRHVEFQKGDTVVTSGYSAIFPAGLMVGTVTDFHREYDDNFYTLEVELSTDFQSLDYVRVMINEDQAEQRRLEKEAREND